ncbi:hypothetical protein LX15_000774 [Streptoalloteichus tenebrarius]|uniref:Uncharacterized protein n=1 Tax=Streptoalloteichus tenebrarius (strain ATCC 17920 / DSM 40477 / JCM 4838 / CBS 697.72 / NBRC 16177 / NCIMB 11028 / NRRL B-12390 / A12253. 1 / ISP 5477) TaxID=1933 RepID=A0ABT1HNJ8_STRSD|nr:hypothetical protein [Streptoalloteichus tenebrarius]
MLSATACDLRNQTWPVGTGPARVADWLAGLAHELRFSPVLPAGQPLPPLD